MKTNYLTLLSSSLLATGITFSGTMSAQALTLNFDSSSLSSNTPATGASASVDFSFADFSTDIVTLTLNLDNTTGVTTFGAGADESRFTGFAFDLPSGVAVTSFTQGGFFDTSIEDLSFTPFSNSPAFGAVGNFDFAVADNGNFNGGNPNGALLPSGGTDTVLLTLSGAGIDATSLETLFTNGFSDGSLDAAVRFQQVNAGAGSDKLLFQPPGNPSPQDPINVPEPGTILSLGLLAIATAVTTKNNQ